MKMKALIGKLRRQQSYHQLSQENRECEEKFEELTQVLVIIENDINTCRHGELNINDRECKELIEKSQDVDAQKCFDIAHFLQDKGIKSKDQDYIIEALYWYSRAAHFGSQEALINIGVLYASGRGVSRNYDLAIRFFNLSNLFGEPTFTSLLNMALVGAIFALQSDTNERQRFEELRSVSKSVSSVIASNNVGCMTAAGIGTSPSLEHAQTWFESCLDIDIFGSVQHNLTVLSRISNPKQPPQIIILTIQEISDGALKKMGDSLVFLDALYCCV